METITNCVQNENLSWELSYIILAFILKNLSMSAGALGFVFALKIKHNATKAER